jgi:peroxiredoxin Q/BCP
MLGFALVAALLVVVAGAAQAPAVGTKAPDFTLKSQEGKTVNLHDFKGKWVVLYFYPKDMTPGCTVEAHNFQADQDQYTKANAAIVGVSVDSVDSHVEFCTKENISFKLLSDEKHEVVNTYGSTQKFGNNEVAQKVYIGVNPAGHSKEVLAALADLQKKK